MARGEAIRGQAVLGRRKKGDSMNQHKTFTSVEQMEKYFGTKWSANWGNYLSTAALLYACRKLEEIAELLRTRRRHRKPRKQSAYGKFSSSRMKAGKSMAEVSAEWRALKAMREAEKDRRAEGFEDNGV